MDPKLLKVTAKHAQDYFDSLTGRKVNESASREDLIAMLGGKLPEQSEDPIATINLLAKAGEVGTVACSGPRYFGFVVGGSVPAAQAADWLTTTWDQNAGLYAISPVSSVAEEITSYWLLEILGIEKTAAVGFVTGAMMANFSALAAARHELLRKEGWDVESEGLWGAPKLNIIVSEEAHITTFNALRLLGMGSATAKKVKVDNEGRMIAAELRNLLQSIEGPTVICAQAGNVNSGAFDPVDEIADAAKKHDAWLHIDGAFGLWAAASPKFKHLVKGCEKADSWAVDGHKWLNVPYDCGFSIIKNPKGLRAAFASSADYLIQSASRDPHEYVPEFSRRARGLAVYAAMRSMGRSGMANLIERCCGHAKTFAELLSKDPRVKILNEVVLNQVVIQFSDNDQLTSAVIERVQQGGICWLSGTKWQGRGAMRISVSNWSTTNNDVETSAAAILRALNTVAPKF